MNKNIRAEAMARARQIKAPAAGLTALAVAACLMSCAGPLDPSPRPTCDNPDVQAFVANKLRVANENPEIVPGTTAQYPAPDTGTARCTVYVRQVVYDTARIGSLPEVVFSPRYFQVRTLTSGFEVAFGW